MNVPHDRHRGPEPYTQMKYRPAAERGNAVRRFIGGSPAAVFLRLLFLSILVGAFMAMLGLTPARLFWQVYDGIRSLIDLGLATFHDFGGWILAGAVVVVPLWFISRLFANTR